MSFFSSYLIFQYFLFYFQLPSVGVFVNKVCGFEPSLGILTHCYDCQATVGLIIVLLLHDCFTAIWVRTARMKAL